MKTKFITLLILLLIPFNLFAVGTPVFDIENWIYSIYQYYQMIQDGKTMLEQVMQAKDQFEKTYQMLASGDFQGIMRSRYSTTRSLQRITNTLDSALDSYTEAQKAQEGLIDADMHWAVPEYFEDVQRDLTNIYESNARNIEQFQESQKEIKEAREQDQDVQNSTLENAATSTSPTQQLAAVIAAVDAGNRQTQEDSISSETNNTLQKTQEEIEEALAEAYNIKLTYKQSNLNSEAVRDFYDDVVRQSAKVTFSF